MKILILFASILFCTVVYAQDTPVVLQGITDSVPIPDTSIKIKKEISISLENILDSNYLINSRATPIYIIQKEKKHVSNEFMFYFIVGLFFCFGIMKLFYDRYVSNVFRVFFNTSLRQSQLTDQLLQAKLPSLLFNIFFCIMGGLYVYLLLVFNNIIPPYGEIRYLWIMILIIAVVYLGKYLVLKFTGWVSGYKQEAGTYIFIVFLINKILSIILMPVVLLIAFADRQVAQAATILSFFAILLLFSLRYLRSYSLLQNKIRIRRLHFFIYIIGVEVIPLLLIYKIAERLLTNNA